MEQLAIIKGVQCGVGEYGKAALWFSAFVDDHVAALQVLSWEQAAEVLESAGVDDVYELNGRACYVECADNTIRFLRMAKI